jgi:putative tricarboxylic transport membrane protein
MGLARIGVVALAIALSMAMAQGAFDGAFAAGAYPTKPITMYDPYPAGSISDIGARVLSQQLSTDLGQPVRVVNATGGNGAVAAAELQAQPADGYTMLWCVGSDLAYVIASKEISYSAQDFKGVELLGGEDSAVVTRTDDKRFGDIKALLTYARAHPGALAFAGSGAGEIIKGFEEMRDATHIQTKYIPYAGGAPVIASLLGGHIDAAITTPSNALNDDKLHVIAILTNAKTYPALPDVPTMGALGYNVESQLLRGVFVKKGTPGDIVDRLAQATQKAIQTASWKQFNKKFLQTEFPMGPVGLDAYMQGQVETWTAFLKKSQTNSH